MRIINFFLDFIHNHYKKYSPTYTPRQNKLMEFIALFFSGIFFTFFSAINPFYYADSGIYLTANVGINNPDYYAYSMIYLTANLHKDWEVLFIYINYIFREAGFAYYQFRFFILLFSITGLWLALSKLKPTFKNKSFFTAYSLTMAICIFVLVLEYFVIRIRAGLSIGMFMWAFYFFCSKKRYMQFIGLSMITSAYFTHLHTAIALSAFIFPPWLFAVLGRDSKLKNNIYFAVLILLTIGFLYYLNKIYIFRGEFLFSKLNPIRLLTFTGIPLVIYFMFPNKPESDPKVSSGIYMFPKLFTQLYIFFASGLAIMGLLGLVNESGEAITRVFILFSLPAIFALRLKGLFLNAKVPSFILLSNAAFFLKTILG